MEKFSYKDVDYFTSPYGWLEAKLRNRLNEGFEIKRNHIDLSWDGIKDRA